MHVCKYCKLPMNREDGDICHDCIIPEGHDNN
jgi:hypothetical protein